MVFARAWSRAGVIPNKPNEVVTTSCCNPSTATPVSGGEAYDAPAGAPPLAPARSPTGGGGGVLMTYLVARHAAIMWVAAIFISLAALTALPWSPSASARSRAASERARWMSTSDGYTSAPADPPETVANEPPKTGEDAAGAPPMGPL